MRVYASQHFSRNRELSSTYIISIDIGDGDTISANFTIDESVIGIFLEKMRALNPEVELYRIQAMMQDQDGQNFAIYTWQTDNRNLISTINGLKESSLISAEFAEEICRELPNLILRARLTQQRQTPDLTDQVELGLTIGTQEEVDTDLNETVFRIANRVNITMGPRGRYAGLNSRRKYAGCKLHDDTPPKDEEWSTKIDAVMQEVGISVYNPLRNITLTESEARATIQKYCDGSFLVFQKNKTYHCLAKLNSEIHQFDVVTKTPQNVNRDYFLFSRLSLLFNLKNDKGDLLFNERGVSACSLDEFLNSHELQKIFPVKLTLSDIKIFKRPASLETLMLSHLLTQNTSLSWLPSLPDELQDKALFYFLDTFISNLYNNDNNANFKSFIKNTLFSEQSYLKPTYRKHYSIGEIERNIDLLRALYKNGCQKAGMALASIVYLGLAEHEDYHGHDLGFGRGGDRDHWVYSLVSQPRKEKEPLFRDLDEYREIIQKNNIVPHKIQRDVFLLRYFKAKDDKEMISAQLKEIDLSRAIWLDQSFCSDNTILSCIENEESKLQQLTDIKCVFHELIRPDLARTLLANNIKHKLPEDVLKEKDEEGRNILHNLIAYLYAHSWHRSFYILEIFNFICQRFPEMLAEQDNEGHTVYDDIKRLKSHRDTEEHIKICNKIELTIENCGVKASIAFGR